MLNRAKLPLWIAAIACIEVCVYLWAVWTSTFERDNFFAIEPRFILDKSARIAGRVSAALILFILSFVGYHGLNKIYAERRKHEVFWIAFMLFTVNHFIHLLFVLLRLHVHGKAIHFDEPIKIGGSVHGLITFLCIGLMPFLLWNSKNLSKFLYAAIILHLLNVSVFMIMTFLGKIKPPDEPAYHNQLGIIALATACMYVLVKTYWDKSHLQNANKLQ